MRMPHATNLFLCRNLALAALSVQPNATPADLPKGIDAAGIGVARLSPVESTPSRHDA
ncbi:hypothetical protein ACW73L_17210 [Methylolobus aquaticus]